MTHKPGWCDGCEEHDSLRHYGYTYAQLMGKEPIPMPVLDLSDEGDRRKFLQELRENGI